MSGKQWGLWLDQLAFTKLGFADSNLSANELLLC